MNHHLMGALGASIVAFIVNCQRTEYLEQTQGSASSALASALGAAAPSATPAPLADGWCPLIVPGTQVRSEETQDGASLIFTTSGDVEAVRNRVRLLAEHHNASALDGGSMKGHGMAHGMYAMTDAGVPPHRNWGEGRMAGGHRRYHDTEGGLMVWVPSQASFDNVPGGARLTLVPASVEDLQPLRARTRWHAQQMTTGPCAGSAGAVPFPP